MKRHAAAAPARPVAAPAPRALPAPRPERAPEFHRASARACSTVQGLRHARANALTWAELQARSEALIAHVGQCGECRVSMGMGGSR